MNDLFVEYVKKVEEIRDNPPPGGHTFKTAQDAFLAAGFSALFEGMIPEGHRFTIEEIDEHGECERNFIARMNETGNEKEADSSPGSPARPGGEDTRGDQAAGRSDHQS